MRITSLFFGLALSLTALASCPEFDVPSSFKAKEALISIGTDVILMKNKTRIGDIQERTLRLTPTFDLYNIDGKKVAQARQKILSLGSTIEVKDCEGKLIGTVRENIFKSFFATYSNYDVLDATGKVVATSEKVELLATHIIVKSKKGEVIMTIKRPMINVLTDTWIVNILKKDALDPRIMTMMPAFKTSADNRRREEEARKKQ